MKIDSSGILCSAKIDSNKACYTFSSFVSLSNGSIIATARGGNNKDSELEGIEFFRSDDEGEKWSEPWEPFKNVKIDNLKGSLKLCYLTEISDSHIIASFLWIDRTSIPGKELFNADTEGCLPMKILIADSYDNGNTWSKLRKVQLPKDIGPPSLTNPIMKLPNGKLIMSIENNKDYYDESKWYQKNIFICSSDNGKTWSKPYLAAGDETGRIFNWDLRCGVNKNGTITSFAWTYDSAKKTFLNIHQRISNDEGKTWSQPKDLNISDQPSHPALLKDGKVVLAWVDRFKNQSIKVRVSDNLNAHFDEISEVTIFNQRKIKQNSKELGGLLADMNIWSFGLPYADVLQSGKVLVFYYAGNDKKMDLHWIRLKFE